MTKGSSRCWIVFCSLSLPDSLLRRVLRRRSVRVSVGTEVLGRVLRRVGVIEGALRRCDPNEACKLQGSVRVPGLRDSGEEVRSPPHVLANG